jgi:ketol-acid reductoisomerase
MWLWLHRGTIPNNQKEGKAKMHHPRMIGSSVRSLYQKGKGFPCFVSVEQDGTGTGLSIALALSRAIGATKAGAIASSAREETAMDLFAGDCSLLGFPRFN